MNEPQSMYRYVGIVRKKVTSTYKLNFTQGIKLKMCRRLKR